MVTDPTKTYNDKMRCVAIDDEPFALKLIADEIAKVSYLELVATCHSAIQAREILEHQKIDLLFLDIQMPGVTGTQFLRTLKNPPLVIITTAYQQYALEGFELKVIDYLMKPIPFDRFLKAVSSAHEQFMLRKRSHHAGNRASFFVRAEYKEIKIFTDDILYVEGLKDYVKIFLQSQTRPILTRLNLKAIEAKLPAQEFCRVHNSFIVSLSKIEASQKSQVFIAQKAIPIGEKYADGFIKRYKSSQ